MKSTQFKSTLTALNLSQAGFARRLSVRPSTVSDWVNDKAKVPGYAIYVLKLLSAIEELKEAVK